ncbi:sugar ABC transporter substrate-binding protein [Actinomadura roseirufa]|uniref:sugar ABC transporter substrate-binding protein n=1 Tax=Actinomadura roseirufa TaxID=2094049 RepID=UPI0013F16A37|nr:sugar ABC transporter substrate-binding protein [Actinomadura roseirufa]
MESKMRPSRRVVRSPLAALVPVVASLLVAGCGPAGGVKSAAPADDKCVAAAKAKVDAAKAPVTFTFGGPSFNASAARGKTIYWIATTGDIPFTKAVYGGFEAAAKAAGVKVNFFDGRGQTSEQLRGMQQAIAAKADLIVLQAIPVGLMGAAVSAAKSAGIPIVEAFNVDSTAPKSAGATASVSFAYSQVGGLLAANVAAGSGCNATAVAINSSDVPVSVPEMDGIKAGFRELCPSTCKLDVRDALIADWSTKVGPLTQNAVADRKVNWLLPVYDGMVQFVTPAVRQANSTAKIASFNASPGIVDDLKTSGSPFTVDIGAPLGWAGWAVADQSLRILTGAAPVNDEKIPLRVFDKANAKGIDFKGAETAIYGGSYVNEYKRLWGLG